MKRRYRVLGFAATLVVTALFVLYAARALRGQDLSVYGTPRALLGIVLASLCWCASAPLMAWAWREMLNGLGLQRTMRELTAILGITQFAKYVPGNVAQYLGRGGMCLVRGIPARAIAATVLLETLLLVAAAGMVGVGTGIWSGVGLQTVRHHGSQLVLVAILVGLTAFALLLFRQFAPRLLEHLAPRHAHVLEGDLFPPQRKLVHAFILYCGLYVAVGVGLVALAHLLLPDYRHDNWLLIAAFSLAWVVGFITPGAPAGLGIREGLLLLMLAPIYATAPAGVLVIALRIATTLGDVLLFGAGWLLLPRVAKPTHARISADR